MLTRPNFLVLLPLAACALLSAGVPAKVLTPSLRSGSSEALLSQTGCPQLVIACPMEFVEQGQPTHFTALVAGGERNAELTYSWTVSAGKISQGQGTASIAIDTSGQGGRRIRVTVDVGGMKRECEKRASCDVTVIGGAARTPPAQSTARPEAVAESPQAARSPQAVRPSVIAPARATPNAASARATTAQPAANARRASGAGAEQRTTSATERPAASRAVPETHADATGTSGAQRLVRYTDSPFEEEKAHLSQLAARLRREPEAQGYIIVYGGRCSSNTEALRRGERAKEWLVNRHSIDASRLVVIDGGFRETLSTELFLGPLEAVLPELTAAREPLDRARCK